MISAIRHTGIVVCDMTKELHFYRDLLEMEVWAEFIDDTPYIARLTQVEGAKVHMVKLRACDGVSIELLQYLSPAPTGDSSGVHLPSNAPGCSHVALQVDDIDALYARLSKAGITFHTPPLLSSDGGAKVAYCRDPEGVIIELVQIVPAPATPHVAQGVVARCE